MKIESFPELAELFRNFRQSGDPEGPYDFNGMVHLLGACLDNLRRNAHQHELDEIPDLLSNHQVRFCKRDFLQRTTRERALGLPAACFHDRKMSSIPSASAALDFEIRNRQSSIINCK